MKITVFSKVLLAWIVHSCVATIIVQTPKPRHLTRIYEAGIDILMTCYGDPHRTVGIVGDSDGFIVRAVRSRYFIPLVLFDNTRTTDDFTTPVLHSLEVFVITADELHHKFIELLRNVKDSIYWNRDAIFLILDTTPDARHQCGNRFQYMYQTNVQLGLLNTQFICFNHNLGIVIFNANPFTRYAPKTWSFDAEIERKAPQPSFYTFGRIYRKGGRTCKDLNFSKTTNLGRYILYFRVSDDDTYRLLTDGVRDFVQNATNEQILMYNIVRDDYLWIFENVVYSLNARGIIYPEHSSDFFAMDLMPRTLIDPRPFQVLRLDIHIFPQHRVKFFAVTQHTAHKTQLQKILTVIDRASQIGTGVVYLVTFLFFKFFLRQAVVPAILNLIRLTCNTGLTKLPENVAPTIYLACLFAFVVILQGIYTGNLASLLTTTISYPNVNTHKDIANLGYQAYISESLYNGLAAYEHLEGRLVKIPNSYTRGCIEYVLRDPLAACILDYAYALSAANKWNLHISQEPMFTSNLIHIISQNNPLQSRLQSLMILWAESGLQRENERIVRLLNEFVDDDEVKKNTVRRVMTLNDLGFAFLILLIGLACSLICFISELVFFWIRLKIAKKRDRARARLAWGPTERNYFSSLNFRFNARRLLSKRY